MDGFSLIQSIVDRYFIYEVTDNASYTSPDFQVSFVALKDESKPV